MIILVKKRNVILVGASLLFTVALYFFLPFLENGFTVSSTVNVARTVILDPGHGGEDPGAVCDFSGIKEKDINLSIGLGLKNILEKDNYKVIMTRDSDILNYEDSHVGVTKKRYQDLLKRKKIMDETPADIIVSIHMNKISRNDLHGAQTFFPPNSVESKRLADALQKNLKDFLEPENKRVALVKNERLPIVIFRNPLKPISVVECGFLSNAEEASKLQNSDYQMKLIQALKNGIDEYYKDQ